MDKTAFIIGMIIYGIVSRIRFIKRIGPELDIGIDRINLNEKYIRSTLDLLAFITFISILIWGILNIFWLLALAIMLGGLFLGNFIVTNENFKRLVTIKVYFEFLIVLISLFLWRKLFLF